MVFCSAAILYASFNLLDPILRFVCIIVYYYEHFLIFTLLIFLSLRCALY